MKENKFYFKKQIIITFLIQFLYIIYDIYIPKKYWKQVDTTQYIQYIEDCKAHKKYNRTKIISNNPYLTVCIPAFNMEKYIERAILSILNQSMQDFEIIVIDDNSNDHTYNILKSLQLEEERIKIIKHEESKGTYYSRVEAILKSKGKFIILLDPDDMFLNQELFEKLYNYNQIYNLDIIEFMVYNQLEGRRNIIYDITHYRNHNHNFSKNIIYQPELANILYKSPVNQRPSRTICRNIWNKMFRKKVFLDMNKYIGYDYFNQYVIRADDMLMNLVTHQFANNYSNLLEPGYMYNLRVISLSRGNGGIELEKIRTKNMLQYFYFFYKLVKQFEKTRNYLYYEMKFYKNIFIAIKDLNFSCYEEEVKEFFDKLMNDIYPTKYFKRFMDNILLYYEEK